MAVLQIGDWFHKHNGRQNVKWIAVLCESCGKKWEIQHAYLRLRKSCGCENPRTASHLMTKTPEYKAWRSMRERCGNPKARAFPGYGGRGITVCDRWRQSFENFFADMGARPPQHSLDRINNDGNYEPSNCRWATRKTQQRNQRTTNWITVQGERQKLADVVELKSKVNSRTLRKRLRLGWDATAAAMTPRTREIHDLTIYEKTMPAKRWARISGTKYGTIVSRLKKGWTHKEAVFGRVATCQ